MVYFFHKSQKTMYNKHNNNKKRLKINKLPNRPLLDIDIKDYGKKNIIHFRGVYMRNNLPKKPKDIEASVINLDSTTGPGTHWVCYYKKYKTVFYFDSFGNVPPPLELIKYFGKNINIKYNYKRKQKFTSFNCGHLCLKFLQNITSQ